MTKIVYNMCFGGFGLSPKAIARYGEIKGLNLVYVPHGDYKDRGTVTYGFWCRDGIQDEEHYFWDSDIERTDPALVQVVEELGEEANGCAAMLDIDELPAGTKYRINEYDGNETIETIDSIEWSVA